MSEHKTSLTAKDNPVSMCSWQEEAVHDLGSVYARKYSNVKDDNATVWTSMYEKNLGRKVSDLPPWVSTESGRKESAEERFGNPGKKDFATIHKDRAVDTGALPPRRMYHHSHEHGGQKNLDVQTAEQRRAHRRRTKGRSGSSEGDGSPAAE